MKKNKIVRLVNIKEHIRQEKERKGLDLKASVVILEETIKLLNINDLQELVPVKFEILNTLRNIKEVLKK